MKWGDSRREEEECRSLRGHHGWRMVVVKMHRSRSEGGRGWSRESRLELCVPSRSCCPVWGLMVGIFVVARVIGEGSCRCSAANSCCPYPRTGVFLGMLVPCQQRPPTYEGAHRYTPKVSRYSHRSQQTDRVTDLLRQLQERQITFDLDYCSLTWPTWRGHHHQPAGHASIDPYLLLRSRSIAARAVPLRSRSQRARPRYDPD